MTPGQRVELFRRLQAVDPHPTTELVWRSPFELLVAVLLSAQATDRSVNAATRGLFAAADSPEAMLALGAEAVAEHVRGVNLHRTKTRHLMAACRMLVDEHGGQVPRTREALERLPGVGRKTANVVLNTAFGEPTLAVDTHIFRVANRTTLAPGATPLAVEQALLAAVPVQYLQHAHHWLLLHGRYTCKARRPECWRCLVADLCGYPDKTADPAAPTSSQPPADEPARRTRRHVRPD